MDSNALTSFSDQVWETSIIPELIDYIRIPAKSPDFDPDWCEHGYLEQAVTQFETWARGREIPGMTLETVRLPGRTPLLFFEFPGASENTILLYGHLDKQPEMTGWREGKGPWTPVLENGRLYGRGAADDGYAMFAALTAIQGLKRQRQPHARCIVLIEACEESGSPDLPFYIDDLADRIGEPELVVCLDSGCGNYEQLWNTTSLRGLVGGVLQVEVMEEGVHSGDAGGVVPSSFLVLRQLLDRLEHNGEVLLPECHAPIAEHRRQQAETAAGVLGEMLHRRFPLAGGTRLLSDDGAELILNRTWRPALSVTGAGGLPPVENAGNVMRPGTALKLSMRLPPTCSAAAATQRIRRLLTEDTPYGARVSFENDWDCGGWEAPELAPWLEQAIDEASNIHFGKPAMHMGEGGTIPFMGMLGEKFPAAQFLVTGVLGPQANAHGPNEFLHLPTAKKLTCCVAEIIARHYSQHHR